MIRLIRLTIVLALIWGTPRLVSAATYPLTYRLGRPGTVSVNVYDPRGGVVRELVHGDQQAAGAHTVIWDGLDREGKAAPVGKYTWKLLQTQGLNAQYLLRVGSNYPVGNNLSSSSGPGTHVSPYTVATDSTGIYISALQTENIETCLLKLSPDGQTRLWSQQLPFDAKGVAVAWEGALSIAVDTGEVYLLGHLNLLGAGNPQRVYVSNAATGAGVRAFDVTWDPAKGNPGATDMDCRGGVLVVAYRERNAIRWYDPKSGALLDTATVTAPAGVSVGRNGTVYVSTGDAVVSLTQASHPLVKVAAGLVKPGRLAVDPTSGELLVYDAGPMQVKRFAGTGGLLQTYGAAGGRQDGLYHNQNFAGFTDLCADNQGGFFVAEAWAAPRRVAHFTNAGTVAQEWYGGQPWDSHADFEPGNPGVMWMTSATSEDRHEYYVMRMTVDYTNRTWQVHSCYQYVSPANPLMGASSNEGGFFHIYEHAGTKYFAIEGSPCISKIDEQHWKLVPVTSFGSGFQWNDLNGDGLVQDSEKSPYTNGVAPRFYVSHLAANFDHYFLSSLAQVMRTSVTNWNANGAPVYGRPAPYATCPPRFSATPSADPRWGAFLHYDTGSGNLYGALNPWTHDWCTSADSFLQQWNARGQATWGVGELGPAAQYWMGTYHPTAPGLIYWNLRGIPGVAHGCVIAIDVDGGWTDAERAHTYVWDKDGLFVGGIMDHPDLNGIPVFLYRCGGEFAHSSVSTLPNGDVLFAGNWENDVRVYRVTGWEHWVRQSGKLTVKTPSRANTGPGLTAEYFADPSFTDLRTVRVDGPIDFDWGIQVPAGTRLRNPQAFSVRWRGSVRPTYGPRYLGYWTTDGPSTNYSDGYCHKTHDIQAAVECKFRGSAIQVLGLKGPFCGIANVYLDGTQVATNFDCYSSNTVYHATLFERSGLASGDHTVTVRSLGWPNRNPAATENYICIDGFVADGTAIDDAGLPYTFTTEADDGSQLWLNQTCVLYDWSVKTKASEKASAPVKLLRQDNPLQLNFYKSPGAARIRLDWSSPLDSRRPVPAAALFPGTTGSPIPAQNIGGVWRGTNSTTEGNWRGVYGVDGYQVIGDATRYPADVSLAVSAANYTWWAPATNDTRALQAAAGLSRAVGAWYCLPGSSLTYDLNFTDDNWHQFALYTLDKDQQNLQTKFEVFDLVGQPLDTRLLTAFSKGTDLVWNLRGHVSLRITPLAPSPHAIVLGCFFDPAAVSEHVDESRPPRSTRGDAK